MLRKKLHLSPLEETADTGIIESPFGLSPIMYHMPEENDIPSRLLQNAIFLNEKLRTLSFKSPVQYVYNPVEYAFDMHAAFLRKYCNSEKKILLLGMNPGPWGMVQTGIPFGEINMVKDWYKIEGRIGKPAHECPEREVMGLNCPRTEISGKRIYEFFKNISETPEVFFQDTYLYNFCPLALMQSGGKNITPSSLKGSVKKDLEEYCRDALLQVLLTLETKVIIALGRYVQVQAEAVLKKTIFTMLKSFT